MKRRQLSLCLGFLLMSSFGFAKEGSYRESSHHIGLGLSAYVFMDDLKEQFNNTVGFTLGYRYTLPFWSVYEPNLGLRIEYYVPRKNGYENQNVLVSPELSAVIDKTYIPLGAKISVDANYWKQTKTYIQKEVFHEDLLYGLGLGVFTRTDLGTAGHLEYSLDYHLQQFSFLTSFLVLGVQYVYDI